MKVQPWLCAIVLGLPAGVAAREAPPLAPVAVRIVDRSLAEGRESGATHRLRLALVMLADTTWRPDAVLSATLAAADILAQCGIRLDRAELRQFAGGPPEWRDLWTPASRELARRAAVERPAVFFVEGTRHRPAFEAEAFGVANTRSRTELAHTVWITAGARDLPIVIAHELAHVLAGSGEHSAEPGNLMGEDTAPGATRLSAAQCARLREHGEREGLLRQVRDRAPAPGQAGLGARPRRPRSQRRRNC